MKKGLVLVSALLLAAAPTAVLAKSHKKSHHAAQAMAAPANPNQNTANMVGDGLHQLAVPFESMAGAKTASAAPAAKHKVKHVRRHKRVSKKKKM
jgi:hypothetical protein